MRYKNVPMFWFIYNISLSYANHEDMVIVFHRSNFIYEILKVVSDNLKF